jgi:hypothetical protein
MNADDRDPEGAGTTVERYGIRGFPTLFVIDASGMIARVANTWDERSESLVRELLDRAEGRQKSIEPGS